MPSPKDPEAIATLSLLILVCGVIAWYDFDKNDGTQIGLMFGALTGILILVLLVDVAMIIRGWLGRRNQSNSK